MVKERRLERAVLVKCTLDHPLKVVDNYRQVKIEIVLYNIDFINLITSLYKITLTPSRVTRLDLFRMKKFVRNVKKR